MCRLDGGATHTGHECHLGDLHDVGGAGKEARCIAVRFSEDFCEHFNVAALRSSDFAHPERGGVREAGGGEKSGLGVGAGAGTSAYCRMNDTKWVGRAGGAKFGQLAGGAGETGNSGPSTCPAADDSIDVAATGAKQDERCGGVHATV